MLSSPAMAGNRFIELALLKSMSGKVQPNDGGDERSVQATDGLN